jgi:uncharacterized lipoprotein YddW (UPF0748 family)
MKSSKRITMVLISFILCLPLLGLSVHAQSPASLSIYMDGKKINSDVPPYVIPKQNITMVPLRVISENLGAAVGWSQSSKTAQISATDLKLSMTVGQKFALVNGDKVPLDASVQVRNNRVMVPLRFVSVQLGLKVNYYQSSKAIMLESDSGGTARLLKGAWVSTIFNLDWPSAGSYGNQEVQQQEYIQLLDELQDMGMNTVFVQVRPSADAFYPSQIVPWSKFLQGEQGLAPEYDPLAFMIDETHKRGMKFHAWFNPFRASTDTKTDNLASNHVAVAHPDWIVNSGGKMYINPGVPDARMHIIAAIMEVVKLYDVDGIHLDDYFYPSSGTFDDQQAYASYNAKGFTDIDAWRRDNINQFVQQLGKSIHAVKPKVEFGISPFGVWRNKADDSSGSDTTASITAYDSMHADVRTWIRQGWIDYVIPQIYWSLTFSPARYDKLVDWWANEVRGSNVDLYIGHSPYKLGTKEAGWSSAQEIINQLKYNKNFVEVKGDVFFSAKDLRRNPLGLIPALRQYYGMK